MEIYAPLVARKAEPGQFIILRVDEEGERIPLTIADFDREKGTITIIYQIVGATTIQLDSKNEAAALRAARQAAGAKLPEDWQAMNMEIAKLKALKHPSAAVTILLSGFAK